MLESGGKGDALGYACAVQSPLRVHTDSPSAVAMLCIG